MRLSAFILTNMEPILQEWEDFARALGAVAESMDVATLRDHAEGILRELAVDLETPQSEAEQEAKSKGLAPSPPPGGPDTAAEMHGNIRAVDGFSLEQMVSEYRALRASVLRLWSRSANIHDRSGYEQITRFNEAIDEALAKSVKRYARDLDLMMVAARARERLAALGTLSAGLGHDMGNMLMPMRVCLQEIEQMGIPPEARSMLGSLRRSVEHLRGLTQGLRSLAVDPDNAGASAETTDLQQWWTEAVSLYKWSLRGEIELHAGGLAPCALPPVRVPKHVLMQAVFNLVQNSAEALAGRSGNIWVSAEMGADQATVALTVRDDGHGMDAQSLARCIDPFYTTKPRARGTGLGLTLIRSAMERHAGRMLIESQPGKGAAFTLVLPIAGPGDRPDSPRRRAIVTVRETRMRAMIRALLSSMGVEVSDKRQGDKAPPEVDRAEAGTAGMLLWVADDSADPREVRRFLEENGPSARAILLGGAEFTDQGGAGPDERLIRIDAAPSQDMLQGALRRAVMG